MSTLFDGQFEMQIKLEYISKAQGKDVDGEKKVEKKKELPTGGSSKNWGENGVGLD